MDPLESRRLGLLSQPQQTAVREFLKFMAFEADDSVDSEVARKALETGWRFEDAPPEAPC